MRGLVLFALVSAALACLAFQAQAQDLDILSGVENIALGWLPQEDRFGRPVLDLSYRRKLWIRSPYDNTRWGVPDLLGNGGIRTAQAFYKYENEVYNSTKEYIEAKGNAMQIGFKAPGYFEFSIENVNKRMKEFLNNTYHKYAVTGEKHLYWTVKAPPPEIASMALSAELKTMMRRTRGVFDASTRQTWFNIFEYYGTHYPSVIELGGVVHMETMIDGQRLRNVEISYVKRGLTVKLGSLATPNSDAPSTPSAPNDPSQGMTPNLEIPTQVGENPEGGGGGRRTIKQKRDGGDGSGGPASVPGIPWGLSFSTVRESYKKMVDDNFRESTKETIELIGGHQNNMRPEQWRDWVPTIIEIPEVVGKKLRPIEELLQDNPDVPNSANIAQVWQTALAEYRQWWMTEGIKQGENPSWKKRTLRSPVDL